MINDTAVVTNDAVMRAGNFNSEQERIFFSREIVFMAGKWRLNLVHSRSSVEFLNMR